MAYPHTPKLNFPLKEYKVNSYKFREDCKYKGIRWGIHLGEDINRKAGTKVKAIGTGSVIYSKLHPGTKKHSNWGNIIIIAHKYPKAKKVFFSLYAHLAKRYVQKGDKVKQGKIIGTIGKANTPEGGWWPDAHLHFAIYKGGWKGKVLPGYWKKSQKRTRLRDWETPTKFINKYTNQKRI